MKALIGVTCSFNDSSYSFYINRRYIKAVERARGSPVILPTVGSSEVVDHYVSVCDGFIFSGGGDLDPVFFGEDPHPGLGEVDPRRDQFELALVREILIQDKPSLFICRGLQVLNVALGGDLIQDIESSLLHQQTAPRDYPFHDILIKENTLLFRMAGVKRVRVNSFHHQAVRTPGPGLMVVASAGDGLVEALEHPEYRFVLGVQWHPEAMRDRLSRILFQGLVNAARERKMGTAMKKGLIDG